MTARPPPFKGLEIRIPITIPMQGEGGLSIRGLGYHVLGMRALASGDGRYLMLSGMRVAMVWALVPWQPYAGVDEHKCGVRMDAQASVCFVLACIIYL